MWTLAKDLLNDQNTISCNIDVIDFSSGQFTHWLTYSTLIFSIVEHTDTYNITYSWFHFLLHRSQTYPMMQKVM